MNKPLLTSIIVFILVFSISCSSKDESEPNPLGEINATMVGNWKGEIKGSLGVAEVTFSIKDSGTISGSGPANSFYCPFSGKWGVKNTKFNVKGTDSCDGTTITMTAKMSGSVLDGSWKASSGNSGTFNIQKQ